MKLRNTCTAILSAAVALIATKAGAQTQYINPPNGSLMLCFREVGSLTNHSELHEWHDQPQQRPHFGVR